MFKIVLTEKSTKDNKKIRIESNVILYKSDFAFLFNRKITKINKIHRKNKRIYIVTFNGELGNSNIYRINYLL